MGKPSTVELKRAADVGAQEAHLTLGGEPVPAEHILVDLEPVAAQRRAAPVDEPSAVEFKRASHVSAEEAQLPVRGEALSAQHALVNLQAIGA
jgi:hypothetical protein